VSQPQVAALTAPSQPLRKGSARIFAATKAPNKQTSLDTSSAFGCCLHPRNSQQLQKGKVAW